MGLFSRKKDQQRAAVTAPRDVLAPALITPSEEPAQAADQQAEMGSALRTLAQKMRAIADGQVTLNLVQQGNDMSYTFYQRGNELEKGSVLPGGDWFTEVADLYVEEEKGERGAFTRALIMVSPAAAGEEQVQASFINAEKGSSHNLNYALTADKPVAPSEQAKAEPVEAEQESTEAKHLETAIAASQPDPEDGLIASNPVERVSARLAASTEADESEDGQASTHKAQFLAPSATSEDTSDATVESVTSEDPNEGTAAEVGGALSSQETEVAAELTETPVSAETETVNDGSYQEQNLEQDAQPTETEGAEEFTAASETAVDRADRDETLENTENHEPAAEASADSLDEEENAAAAPVLPLGGPSDLPIHLDDDAFDTHDEQTVAAPAAVSRPALASAPLDAPSAGANVDVAPSFAAQSYTKPSETTLAEGNLVLTEAEVVSRFAPAYDALFGENGTALDVSTVLIRVRSLGSYYDALTHVRRNGFWEQVRTFDLVPEETLAILQLKADSYKEGSGSPLAINIRFTPGVPAAVSFDYTDEEAFISYPERLPAQQYVEELRMFPRTGANIPAHMNDALASWTF
ncbi:hypothetical protein [Rothia endophytica]|uniref:hypothetical protein n=1 Tax=Rothia endophytica TaxID=1324766 RepID=UPI001F218BCB|nr:hypothetical protein [Rothia endophytica]